MTLPLWKGTLRAIRRFNMLRSLPRTALSSLRIFLGLERLADDQKPVLLTSSISEDYVRVWFHFAMKATPDSKRWHVVIIDSAGDMDASLFPGAKVVRFWNQFYHGAKIDAISRHVIGDHPIFLCDDDKYLLADPSPHLETLRQSDVGAVSLSPRKWYVFRIDGKDYLPMGSYALLFKPALFRQLGLVLRQPRSLRSPYKIFPASSKQNTSYDTADYANEQLLLRGLRVVTEESPEILGFDGMSATRILLQESGSAYVRAALEEAVGCKEGSVNGAVLKALYGLTAFERLYRDIFRTEPRFVSGFTNEALRELLHTQPHFSQDDKAFMLKYFDLIEDTYRRLQARI